MTVMLGFFYGYGFQWWDLLMIPGLLLGLYAQFRLSSSYGRFSQVPTDNGLTGAEAARRILDAAGLSAMPINEVPGHLTDHYDPIQKALFLSSDNYHGASVAAVGVAAHEAGHALQHKAAYGPLHLRMAMVPLVGFASGGAWLAFILGMILFSFRVVSPSTASTVMGVGVGLFAIITFFQLVTLPVEFDASSRAKQQLSALGLVGREQLGGVSNVLGAAAMTYVAALASSMFELLRLILIMRSFDNRNDRS